MPRAIIIPPLQEGQHNLTNAEALREATGVLLNSRLLVFSYTTHNATGTFGFQNMTRSIVDTGFNGSWGHGLVLPWETGLAGLAVTVSNPVTTGNLQFQVTKDGTLTYGPVTYDSTTKTGLNGQARLVTEDSSDTQFEASTEIRVQISGNAYAVTADVEVLLFLAKYDE